MVQYFENEIISIFGKQSQENKVIDKEAINEKYQKGDVRIVTEQGRFQLTTVQSIVESEEYILDPEFQRRHRWNATKKSKLIESFIMNVPVPPIFLYEIEFSVYEVMDGLQRLTAISEFYNSKFKLEGLEEWPELNGLKYSDLPTQVRKGIDRRYLSSMILLKETAKSKSEEERLKQLVFERINSGGESLEDQETRNALYNGPLNKICIRLSRDPYFCRMWGIPESKDDENDGQVSTELSENKLYRKMQDVELVLRFFAFRHIDKWERITLKQYLDCFLKAGNLLCEDVLNNYEKLFKDTCELAYNIFDDQAFCLLRVRDNEWKMYNRPTKVVFDPMMHVLSGYLENKESLLARKEEIKEEIEVFYKKYYSLFGGRNTGKSDVQNRIVELNKFFSNYIGDKNEIFID